MANLWDNPSIESGVTDWSGKGGAAITQSSTQAWHGTYSARCAPAADTWSGIESTFKQIVDPSTQYTASLYIYPTASVSLTFEVDGNAYDWLGASTGTHSTDTWTRVSVTFTTDGDHDSVQLKVFKNNSADTNYFYIDGVQLETGASATIWEDYSSATQIDCTVGTVAVADKATVIRPQVEGAFYMFYDLADHLGQQLHSFGSDTFKVGLIDGSIIPAQTSAAAWGTFSSSEVSGTGYSAGGVTLSSVSFNEASGTATFDATDTTYSYNAAGPTNARYAILYNDSDATTPKAAIGWLDLGTEVSLRDGDLVLQWAGDGICQIAPP